MFFLFPSSKNDRLNEFFHSRCVCAKERERERKRERKKEREREKERKKDM